MSTVSVTDAIKQLIGWRETLQRRLGEPGPVAPADITVTGGGGGGSVDWVDITGKPSTFPPSAHTHPQSEVTGLVAALEGKSNVGHTHPQSDITGLVADLAAKAPLTRALPPGGATGHVLTKLSAADYDVGWAAGGGGGGGGSTYPDVIGYRRLTADYLYSNTTDWQDAFPTPNITLPVGLYRVTWGGLVTAMGSVSGNMALRLRGTTAVLGSAPARIIGRDSTATGWATGSIAHSITPAASGSTDTPNATTAAVASGYTFLLDMLLPVTTAGNVIAEIALTTAVATATMNQNMTLVIERLGDSATALGSWS